ncbi:MAG: hypothetical protein ACFB11_00705 [Paracoccaceae bacterium]
MSIAMHKTIPVYDQEIAQAMWDEADFAVNVLVSGAKIVDALELKEDLAARSDEDLAELKLFAEVLIQLIDDTVKP